MSPRWLWLRPWLVACGLACLAFGTWRSFPTLESDAPQRAPLRVLLFDLSGGTTRLRPGHSLWARGHLREQAQLAQARGEELAVGLYGRDVRSIGSGPAEPWLGRLEGRDGELLELALGRSAERGSNLDGALALFEAPLTDLARPSAQLVIAGLQDYSGADPAARLARLAQAGVAIEWSALPAARRMDLALEGLRLPEAPAVGAPLVAEFELSLGGAALLAQDPPRQLQLKVEIEDARGIRMRTLTVQAPAHLPDAQDSLQWSTRLELGPTQAGRTRVLAKVALIDAEGVERPDPLPENDTLSARCRAGRVQLVAAVAAAERHPDVLAWIGRDPSRWPGIQWRVIEPRELPDALGQLDVIVSVDLGPGDLPASLVESFVQAGGGWLFCGGWGSLAGWFGSGEVRSSGLNGLLPLFPAPGGGTPRDVLVLVDGSGSMAGEAFARVQEALADLVLSVPPEDALTLHFFTGTLRAPVDLRASTDGLQAAVKRLFEVSVPGGPTAILYSLETLVEWRKDASRDALVILLSDGKEVNSFRVAERAAAISTELSRGESRLVVIAAGDDPNLHLLQALVDGAPVPQAGSLGDLSEIFQREVFARRARNGNFAVRTGGDLQLAESTDLLAAWNSLGAALPDIQRYLRCDSTPGADVLWRAEPNGEPLLAWQRIGRGKVAAWASAPLVGWAEAYSEQDARLAALLRQLAPPFQEQVAPRLEWRGGRLQLESVPADWPAEVALTFNAQLPGQGLERLLEDVELASGTLTLGAQRPGLDPRRSREGELPAALLERALGRPLSVVLRDPRDGELLGLVGLDLPCASEYLRRGTRRVDPLRRLGRDQGTQRRAALAASVDPRAWIWLVLGVSLLSVAGLMGALGRAPSPVVTRL